RRAHLGRKRPAEDLGGPSLVRLGQHLRASEDTMTRMLGRMMDYPLNVTYFIERARELFGAQEIVSRGCDKSVRRASYAQMLDRCGQLANALARLGVRAGDRVATLAWNHQQHLEAYLAAPSMGAVGHTLNLRLHPSELGYIANHAEDRIIICDR